MNKFELSSAFIIGQEKIDSDHLRLVKILNDMVDGIVKRDVAYCQLKWEEFFTSLEQHLKDEEKIMHDFGFIHKNTSIEHKKILTTMRDLGNNGNSITDWKQCIYKMRDGLLTCILKEDLIFAEFLATIGYSEK